MSVRAPRIVPAALTMAVTAAFAVTNLVGWGPAAAAPDDAGRDLQELRTATAPFHDVDEALAAGWAVEPMCMDYPDGFHGEPPGTMGHHFYNVDALTDGGLLDPAEPELLLYEKRADGSWRFNAVEYVVPARDLPGTAKPPVLFGQQFRFYPEIGSAGIWGLHVWIWRHNPRGMYVNLNPNVSCEFAED